MELLDIVDEKGIPTGKTVEREYAHEHGILHRTSHVWIFRKKNDQYQVLLQRRSKNKDSYPDCYDISSAGHIPSGFDYVESAIRELKEELGIDAKEEELQYCGTRTIVMDSKFWNKEYHDRQISNIYILMKDIESKDLTLQQEEVSEVIWMDFDECVKNVKKNRVPHCIYMEELSILSDCLK